VIGFALVLKVDPDPVLYRNAGDPDPGNQTDADPCGSGEESWSDFKVPQKLNSSRNIPRKEQKFLVGRKPGLFVNYRICILKFKLICRELENAASSFFDGTKSAEKSLSRRKWFYAPLVRPYH
jgi:hypothetical protein